MEELKEHYENLLESYNRLDYSIKRFSEIVRKIPSKTCNSDDDCFLIRDALIKRFEFCYDLTWKFLKRYLENNYGVVVASPKKVFQECIKQNLVDANKTDLLLQIVEARNNTSHTYNEEIAHDIALQIPRYYDLFMQITKNITM